MTMIYDDDDDDDSTISNNNIIIHAYCTVHLKEVKVSNLF